MKKKNQRLTAAMLALGVMLSTAGCSFADNVTQAKDDFLSAVQSTECLTDYNGNANWYKDAVFYHVWVKAFADSNGDGCGDLNGITAKLDYFNDGNPRTGTDLGVTALWLSPIFECNYKGTGPEVNMHGYDTVNYYAVNSLFGTEADLKNLINEAHKRGIKVIFDYVPNHTADQHPWFVDSINGVNGKSDWYVWADTQPDYLWGKWYYKADNMKWYYSFFWGGMPDLNYYNPDVVSEMKNVVKHWLDFGFDGFRNDAAPYLYEIAPSQYQDAAMTHAYYASLREMLDEYAAAGNPKAMMAEVLETKEQVKTWYGPEEQKEFHMVLDFLFTEYAAKAVKRSVKSALSSLYNYQYVDADGFPKYARPATFISNHDNVKDRPMTFYYGDANKARLADALSILSPGTPIIYYGNEIGQADDKTYGSGDIRHRQAFKWDLAATEIGVDGSLHTWYRNLIKTRNSFKAFKYGSYEELNTGSNSIFAYVMTYKKEQVITVFNLADTAQDAVIDFTGSSVRHSGVKVVIGADRMTDRSINRHNYESFKITGIPKQGFRVYSLSDHGPKKIAEDVNEYTVDPSQIPVESMYIRGSMNSWGATPMTLDSNGIWTITLLFTAQSDPYQFKFDKYADWSTNWGDNGADYIVETDGSNICLQVDVTREYTIKFDEDEMTYSIQ